MWVGDALRLRDYWKFHPPLHVMVAGYLGIEPPRKLDDDTLGQMLPVKVLDAPAKSAAPFTSDEGPPVVTVVGPPPPNRIR